MEIERTKNEIVIRISSDLDSVKLQSILDLLMYGELTSKSSATQKQVDSIATDTNKSWWKKNRQRFIK